jgi:hypothetical protein
MNPATDQRASRRDRTNVCMCHLDHLLQLQWAHYQRVPPTEAARPQNDCLRMTPFATPVKISRGNSSSDGESNLRALPAASKDAFTAIRKASKYPHPTAPSYESTETKS